MKSTKKPKANKPKLAKDPVESTPEDNAIQFELELCWCIQQIENAINSGKLSKKQVEDSEKNLKILKSSTSPLVKKRQLMKSSFGDYRAKMKDEEKKLSLGAKQIKFTAPNGTAPKANFVKKSAILNSGKEFRFNFESISENKIQLNSDSPENASVVNRIDLKQDTGSSFKFNFTIEQENNDFSFNELKIA